ncbi:MAG: type VI secretion system tip protein VgrG [Acidobacteriota bacterium]|nr:type VI secretion system tip protein VgrG [Acidobacteriota bacterium]MDH3529314.1 type VI secretion system tip protein VgrG [Acidobacteriota bacterium]
MTTSTQQNRLLNITTPLGEDFLLLSSVVAREEISQLFSIDVELLHDENEDGYVPTDVDATSILGKMVGITVAQRDGTTRYLNGMVNQFSQGNRNTRFTRYSATIVPHVWLLTQIFQSRIFQHKSVPEILREVFDGFNVSYEIQGEFNARNYCVQYRETDFAFASRLMEEEGLFYYFEHSSDSHKMIIANSAQSHQNAPSKDTIPFYAQTSYDEDFISTIRDIWVDRKLQTGKVTLWDHNFQLHSNKLDAQQPSLFTVGDNQNLEHYDFPAGYGRKYDGIDGTGGERAADLQKVFPDKAKTAENMMNALDSGFEVLSGISDCSSLTAGHRFTLEDHPNDALNAQYIITAVTHQIEQNPKYVTDDVVEQPYSNSFTCIPHGSGAPNYCPPRTIPKPLVNGSQTATVVGPSGEEIFTDKYGRVKVQFHWDRHGDVDANSSCWIRVSQGWAGNRWGMMFIPRIGMEVLVNFIDGDPDQPIISGCVYNPAAMPPYDLPDEKTKMTIKSDSSKGGNGFNELRFEDKKGEEQVFIRAEKDMDVRVLNDKKEIIGRDTHLKVERHQLEDIVSDKHLKVGGDRNEEVAGTVSLTAANLQQQITQNFALDAGSEVHIKGGMNCVMESDTSLTIKAGGSFITMSAAGIFIKGMMVNINSGGAAGSGSGCSPNSSETALEAVDAEAGGDISASSPPPKPKSFTPLGQMLKNASRDGTPFCEP